MMIGMEKRAVFRGAKAQAAETPSWTAPTWQELVRDHSAQVYRLAYRLTGNRPDAEDLTQDVFVRVFKSINTFQPGTLEGWLHRITTNLFLDQARRRQRIRMDALSALEPSDDPSRVPNGVCDQPTVRQKPMGTCVRRCTYSWRWLGTS